MTTEVEALTRELFRVAADLGHRAGRELGLGSTDLAALRALDELAGEPARVGWLSQRLGLSSAATTALLDRLELEDVVRREAHPHDRRQVLVRLRPKARRAGRRLLAPYADRIERAAGDLDETERQTVVRFLRDVLGPGQS